MTTFPSIILPLRPVRRGGVVSSSFCHRDFRRFNSQLRDTLTECEYHKVLQLFFGLHLLSFTDTRFHYPRRVWWRIGRYFRLRYVVRDLLRMVEKSEAFCIEYDDQTGEAISFYSPYLKGVNFNRQLKLQFDEKE